MAESKYFENESLNPVDEIYRMHAALTKRVSDLERELRNQASPPPIPRIDPLTLPDPYEGQRGIDVADEQHTWYSDGQWRKAAAGGLAIYEIKVFADDVETKVEDKAFEWEIPEDLDGAILVKVEGFITTAGSGSTQVAMRLNGTDILSTKITIDSGELNSKDALVQPVVVPSTTVAWGDHLDIDVDSIGGGGMGLGVIVTLAPAALASVTLTGAQGDPGGIISWQGAWSSSTTYVINQAVTVNGSSYVAIGTSTNVEPGVTSGWQTYWMLLAGAQQISEVASTIDGHGLVIQTGLKGYLPVYFNCTIVEATILANTTGSAVVDIWKDTYGNYPPTVADSITGSTPPTLSSATHNTDTALTGWTTAITAGDVLAFNVNSCSVLSLITISLKVLRT